MRIYLATWTEKAQKESLDNRGYQNRLLSYWFIALDPRSGGKDLYIQNPEEKSNNDHLPSV
jgi:hypothetical protein